ncbi:MAG: co-chaperone GroES [Anaerolineae bacterium]
MSNNGTVKLQPLGARVLIKPLEAENRTASGILLPETAKEKPQMGEVIAIGDDENIKVQVGDKVLFAKYTGTEIKHEGVDYVVMDSNDILLRFAK